MISPSPGWCPKAARIWRTSGVPLPDFARCDWKWRNVQASKRSATKRSRMLKTRAGREPVLHCRLVRWHRVGSGIAVEPPNRESAETGGVGHTVRRASLWFFEISNTLLVLMRRKRIAPEQWTRARLELVQLHPIVDEEGPRLAMGKIADLAHEHALSVYDATYLELALRRRLPSHLATLPSLKRCKR